MSSADLERLPPAENLALIDDISILDARHLLHACGGDQKAASTCARLSRALQVPPSAVTHTLEIFVRQTVKLERAHAQSRVEEPDSEAKDVSSLTMRDYQERLGEMSDGIGAGVQALQREMKFGVVKREAILEALDLIQHQTAAIRGLVEPRRFSIPFGDR